VQHSISHVTYTSNGGGAVPGTMVRPAAARGALPAVIVIHEAWGPDAHIQDVADRIATAGYLAFVPDLYAHGGSRPAALAPDRIDALKRFTDTLPAGGLGDGSVRTQALEELPDTERARVEESMAALFAGMNAPDQFVIDLRGAVAHLRDHPDCNGQIGAVGFCLGGGLAGLLACDEPALRARIWEEVERGQVFMSGLIAQRSGRDPDDFEIRVTVMVVLMAAMEAMREWVRHDGKGSFVATVSRALDLIDAQTRLDELSSPRAGGA